MNSAQLIHSIPQYHKKLWHYCYTPNNCFTPHHYEIFSTKLWNPHFLPRSDNFLLSLTWLSDLQDILPLWKQFWRPRLHSFVRCYVSTYFWITGKASTAYRIFTYAVKIMFANLYYKLRRVAAVVTLLFWNPFPHPAQPAVPPLAALWHFLKKEN